MAKAKQLVLIECDAYNLGTSTRETLRWSFGKFITKASDTPARTPYLNCIHRRPRWTRTLHGEGRTFGPVDIGTGEFELGNGWDQAKQIWRLDHYKTTYRFNDAPVRVYLLEKSSDTYATKSQWARGVVMGEPEYLEDTLRFAFADREGELKKFVLSDIFTGANNVGGRIVDGDIELAGVYKQKIWGNPRDMTGQVVNPGLQIYRLGDTFKAVTAIRDNGLATFSVASDLANATALASATISSTEARTCKALGLVRFGSIPAGQVRFDVECEISTAASMIADIVALAGWSASDLTTSTIARLASLNSDTLQLLVDSGSMTVGEALDEILRSIGGNRVHERTGTMTLGIMVAPTSAASLKDITAANSGDVEMRQSSDTNRGLPPWKTRVGWYRRWAPLSRSDFAGAVVASAIEDQMMEQRWVEAIVSTIKDANRQSEPFEIERTLHVTSAGAQSLASSQQALRGAAAGRDFFYVPLPLDRHTDLDPGDVVTLKRPRYGLTGGGKPVVITTLTEDLEENEVDMEAYG